MPTKNPGKFNKFSFIAMTVITQSVIPKKGNIPIIFQDAASFYIFKRSLQYLMSVFLFLYPANTFNASSSLTFSNFTAATLYSPVAVIGSKAELVSSFVGVSL